MNGSTKTERSIRCAASHRSFFCPFFFFLAFFLSFLPSLFHLTHSLAASDDTSTSLRSQNVPVTSQSLTFRFIKHISKVSKWAKQPFLKKSKPGPPPKRFSPDWSYLTQLSLTFCFTLMVTQTGERKSLTWLNSSLLFVKAFVHHLLLRYN